MSTERARKLRGTRPDLGVIVRSKLRKASISECKPLVFGDIKKSDRFISMPMPGDNSGHGGFLNGAYHLFIKTELICHPQTPTNSTRLCDGSHVYFKDEMFIIKIK